MTVTVTGTVTDVSGRPDRNLWSFASVIREGSSGAIVSTTPRMIAPDEDGHLAIDLEPGYCAVTYQKQSWIVTVPNQAIDLWDLIEAAVTVPPGTSQDALIAAIATYFEQHPIAITGGTP